MSNLQPVFSPNNHSVFEMRWKPAEPAAAATLSRLLQDAYGFDEIHAVDKIDEWERTSNNFRVTGIRNGDATIIHVRKYLRIKNGETIDLLNRILTELHQQNVKVPQPIASRKGELHIEYEGNLYQCFQYIEGHHYRGTENELREYALHTARLDSALRKLSMIEEIQKKPLLIPPWHEGELEEFAACAKRRRDVIDETVMTVIDEMKERAHGLKQRMTTFAEFPSQPIHYDLHPHNTIFRGEELQAILDFETVRMGELVRDVGMACHRSVRQYIVYQKRPWQETLPTGIHLFMSAYTSILPLDSDQLSALPTVLLDELIGRVCFILRSYYHEGNDMYYRDGGFEKHVLLVCEAHIIGLALSDLPSI